MNMPIICVRSFCGVNEVPDFTNCKRVPGRAYNGANGKKIAIEHQGEQYMLKFPPSGQGKRTELSYTNSCISEHIASTIFNMVGIPAQETILGTYDVGGKTKIVCACKDFTADGSKLFDFCSIKNTVIDSEYGGTGTELEDILDTPISPELLPPDESGKISQYTEDLVGPYALHDFFLYYMLRFGFAPRKIFTLACRAFEGDFDGETVKKWLKAFYRRFFTQQFKRSCLPDGVKVGSVCLSPRGDWRMPSDAVGSIWLQEVEQL